MAYELKRSPKIEEEIKIGENTIAISLDVDTISGEFNKRYNEIMRAEQQLQQVQNKTNEATIGTAIEAYGNAVIALFQLIFREDGAKKIIAFYENKYLEMSQEVFPFIIEVVFPKIQHSIHQQRENLTRQYKQKQTSILGLNRSNRRKMGF